MRKRTTINLDVHGFATASEQEPLAVRAEGVSKLCAWLGCEAAAQKLGKPKGWISKMRRVDKDVKSGSVVGALVLQGRVQDLEIAYYMSLIQSRSGKKVREIADNIDNETRQTVRRAWEELRMQNALIRDAAATEELVAVEGFRPFPRRGGVVTNELIDKLRDEYRLD